MRSFHVESLESRRLMSATAGADSVLNDSVNYAATDAVVTPAAHQPPFELAATVPQSTFVVNPSFPQPTFQGLTVTGTYTTLVGGDFGIPYIFTGTGVSAKAGQGTLSGHVRLPGFIAFGHAKGKLTLTFGSRVLTLSVKGPKEPGFGPFPAKLFYAILDPAGNFTQRVGQVDVTLGAGHTFTFAFHPGLSG